MTKSYLIQLIFLIISFSTCEHLIVNSPKSNKNIEDFEAVWNRVNDVYPYLEFKKINWDSLYNVYLPKTSFSR